LHPATTFGLQTGRALRLVHVCTSHILHCDTGFLEHLYINAVELVIQRGASLDNPPLNSRRELTLRVERVGPSCNSFLQVLNNCHLFLCLGLIFGSGTCPLILGQCSAENNLNAGVTWVVPGSNQTRDTDDRGTANRTLPSS